MEITLENYLQETGALGTLSGILAGFAIAAVIEVLNSEKQSRLMTAAVITFSASGMMFFYALMSLVLLFAAAAELNKVPVELSFVGTSAVLAMLIGVFVFLASLALVGWVRSKATGIIVTIMALVTTCLVGFVISAVMSLFAGA